MTTDKPIRSIEHAAATAASLPGEYFQVLLAATKIVKDGRFNARELGQMVQMYWRDFDTVLTQLDWQTFIEAEGRPHNLTGWYRFTEFGAEVLKHVRKIDAKRNGRPDPDAKPSTARKVVAYFGTNISKIVWAGIGVIALGLLNWWLKTKGINLSPFK